MQPFSAVAIDLWVKRNVFDDDQIRKTVAVEVTPGTRRMQSVEVQAD